MNKKILIVVDMQNDFTTGSLGTKEAQAVIPNVIEKIKEYEKNGDAVVFTQDTHYDNYLETQEGKLLPVEHCIQGTDGWNICGDIYKQVNVSNKASIGKETFGSIKLVEYLNGRSEIELIELIGVCTDICVVSNAILLKAFMPEVHIKVDGSCCAGVTPEKHEAALEVMRSCQIEVV